MLFVGVGGGLSLLQVGEKVNMLVPVIFDSFSVSDSCAAADTCRFEGPELDLGLFPQVPASKYNTVSSAPDPCDTHSHFGMEIVSTWFSLLGRLAWTAAQLPLVP